MQIKLSSPVRFLLAGAIFVLYILSLVQWNAFDGIIKAFPPAVYGIGALLGILTAAILYAVLPTKKTVEATKKALHNNTRTQPNASTPRERAIGYWKWLACGVVFFTWMLPIYISEM